MRILFISPLGFAINDQTTYAGIERLVWYYSRELNKLGHEVAVFGHTDSVFPEGIKNYDYKAPDSTMAELQQFRIYQSVIRDYDVIHDFSHLHLISRYMPNMPTLNLFWHAPILAQYPKAPYNIIALSKYAEREFERVYHYKARYHQSICIDTSLYKLSKRHRNDRFLAIGRIAQEKGHHNAIEVCKAVGASLDIIGARGLEMQNKPYNEYEQSIMSQCDSGQIRLVGDVNDTEKIRLMQTNKALIYATDHPEVTSHKDQEALLCGLPAILSAIGAAPEIVTHGVDGFLCYKPKDFLDAVMNVDKLDCPSNNKNLIERYSVESVVQSYLSLYIEVANGLRWK